MSYIERLCNRRNWLEALGLCLLFHLCIGILLSGITYHSTKINTFEQFISITPVTTTIEEPQVDYGVVKQPESSLTASNNVFKKNQATAPVSRIAVGNTAHKPQPITNAQGIEPQKQSEVAIASIATEKENISTIPSTPFKQDDSQTESIAEDIRSAENAGGSEHTVSSLHENGSETNVAVGENKRATSADILSDYKKYLKASIECAKQYPLIARRRGEEGRVGVVFELDRFGRLLTSRIEMSSGIAVLDEAAIRAVMNAAPFSRPPVEDASLSFMVVLDFKLSNMS